MPTIEHAGGPLNYDITDERLPWFKEGPSIVFHHGVGACGDVFRGWTATLMERFRLVRFDMRGHGGSPVPAGFKWTLAGMVADLHAVILASCNGPVHLVGESIGGTVVLAYALEHKSRVATVTVSNGAHRGSQIQNLDDWATTMGQDGMDAWSAQMMQRRFHPGAITKRESLWFETQQASADPQAILDAVAVLVGADMSDALGALDRPVLLLHPDESPFIPIPIMADLKDRLPDARMQVFAHAKHGLPFSHALECARATAAFLAARG